MVQTVHWAIRMSAGVVDNVVVGWGDAALADRLAHNVEVIPGKQLQELNTTKQLNKKTQRAKKKEKKRNIPLWAGDFCVDDGAWGTL